MKVRLSSFRILFSALLIISIQFAKAQPRDTAQARLNTLKFNVVSSFIYTNAAVLSYERVTKPMQSWGAMIGYVQFPKLGEFSSSVHMKDDNKRNGFVIGGEYRFYLKKENKYPAPHGIYLGPYVNYFSFNNERVLSMTSTDGNNTVTEAILTTDIRVLNIGAQIGYQFVVNDRWTFDMVIAGPSLSHYSLKLNLDGNYDPAEGEIIEDEILAALVDHFPVLKDLITDQSATLNGTSRTWGKGFRYQFNIGYRFGKKK